jgi:hypothetical protein
MIQEIETLLGRQVLGGLYLERWSSPCGNAPWKWQEPPSSNVPMPTPAMSEAHELAVDVPTSIFPPPA